MFKVFGFLKSILRKFKDFLEARKRLFLTLITSDISILPRENTPPLRFATAEVEGGIFSRDTFCSFRSDASLLENYDARWHFPLEIIIKRPLRPQNDARH